MKKAYLLAILIILLTGIGCGKYLDLKADKTTSTIETADDLLKLMNYEYLHMMPALGLMASDEFYIPDSELEFYSEQDRDAYVWNDRAQFSLNYFFLYERVYYANVILANVDRVRVKDEMQRNELKGAALFLRGFAFLQAAELYAPHFKAGSNNDGPGIILRLDPDPNLPSYRSGLQETYQQIAADLESAVPLLPIQTAFKNRPNKAAGHALLARFYLQTEQYDKAKKSATESLALQPVLLDFQTLTPAEFTLGDYAANPEILYFQNAMDNMAVAWDNTPRVDTFLRRLYEPGDLRNQYFFYVLPDGTETFHNSYTGTFRQFTGICTDEVYLIRAECSAREGKIAESMQDLNTLLRARWESAAFVPITAANGDDALKKVLAERRKELLMRGVRWADLKRLNATIATATTIARRVGGQDYSLAPNDRRYAWLLPEEVIKRANIQQTPR